MKKILSILIMALMVTFTVSASGSSETAGDSAKVQKLKVGSVIMNTSGEWYAEVIKGMEAAGEELGVDVSIVSSDNEISKEADNVDRFVAQGVDAISISPLSADGSVASVENTMDAGIPVINWNTTVNTKTNGFVGVSNYELGKLTGEYAVKYVNENFDSSVKMALLTNSSYEVGVERCNGFKDAVAKEGKINVVAAQDAELMDEGVDITEQILTAQPDVDIFWAWNLTSLQGCIAAIENLGRKDIVIMGTDMSVDVARSLQSDSVDLEAVTTQMPYDIGYQSIKLAIDAVNGKSVPETTLIPLKTYIKSDAADVAKYIEEHEDLVGR
jgi:ABC-type sugar transport system substrate-binding protein